MTQIIGIIFIAVVVIALILEDKKSSREFYEKRIKKLEDEKSRAKSLNEALRSQQTSSRENVEQEEHYEAGYTSITQFNDAVDEIEKNIKYSPLERIYYESKLPDQIKNEVSLRVKTKEHLTYLARKGITQNDISSAKNIISQREEAIGTTLNLKSFTEDYIQQKGKVIAKEIFLGLVKIFEVAGRDVRASDEVYKELFEELPF
ncbi:hypothetical protein [Winogradskyella luteola]|uniref:Uncharacterized protein n=1 Tax=Winogradskyella luteola TaxID=2828330 RepID=A0A9X1FA85_9FLAO|nr:hypothetical protein [Winogradskyella luteola]MBV7270162.1 hypothetical protein [Winogradskyella luteola]